MLLTDILKFINSIYRQRKAGTIVNFVRECTDRSEATSKQGVQHYSAQLFNSAGRMKPVGSAI